MIIFNFIKNYIIINLFIIINICYVLNFSYATEFDKIPNGKYVGEVFWQTSSIDGCMPGYISYMVVTDKYIILLAKATTGQAISHKYPKDSSTEQIFEWTNGDKFSFKLDMISLGKLSMTISKKCPTTGILINKDLAKINVDQKMEEIKAEEEKIKTEVDSISTIKEDILKVESEILELKTLLTKLSEDEENLLDKKYEIIEQRELEIKKEKEIENQITEKQKNIEAKIEEEKQVIIEEKKKIIEERKELKKLAEKEIAEAKQKLEEQSNKKIKQELDKNKIEKEKLDIAREELKVKKEKLELTRSLEVEQIRNKQIWSNISLKYFFKDIELFLSLHKDEIDMLKFIEIFKPVKIIKNKEIFNAEDLKSIKRLETFLLENNDFKKINEEAILQRKYSKEENITVAKANLDNLLEFTYSYLVNNAMADGIEGLTRLYNTYKDTTELKSYKEIKSIFIMIKNELSILGVDYK